MLRKFRAKYNLIENVVDLLGMKTSLKLWRYYRRSRLGLFSSILIVFNGLLMLLHLFEVIPYFNTVFYPLLCLWAFLTGLLGWMEYDKTRKLAVVGTCLGGALLIHWIVVLVMSVTAS